MVIFAITKEIKDINLIVIDLLRDKNAFGKQVLIRSQKVSNRRQITHLHIHLLKHHITKFIPRIPQNHLLSFQIIQLRYPFPSNHKITINKLRQNILNQMLQ